MEGEVQKPYNPPPQKPRISGGIWIIIVLDFIFGSTLLIVGGLSTFLYAIDNYTFDFVVYFSLLSIAFFACATGFLISKKSSTIIGYSLSVLVLIFFILDLFTPAQRLIEHSISRIESLLQLPPTTLIGFEALGIVLPLFLAVFILFIMSVVTLPLFIQNLKKLNQS